VRRETLWVVLSALLSLWIHAKYRLSGFGEQDAARLTHDIIIWHLRGQIISYESTYRMHTSAGYIHVLKLALDHGLPIARLPRAMNWLSVVLGTTCSVVLYALFRQFSAPRYAALAIFMYAATPGFWLANVYGMPTIPALCGFSLSLLCFVRVSRLPKLLSPWLPVLTLASFACLFWAMSFKADIMLCTGVFVAVALSVRGARLRLLALASLIVLGTVIANNRYVHAVLIPASPGESTRAFLKSWNAQFPFKLEALLDPGNNQTIVHCVGGLLFSLLVLSVLASLAQGGRARRLALGALAWAGPPVLFWGLQYGDSARHNVFGIAPLFVVAAHFVFRIVDERTPRALGLGLLLVLLSYVSDTKSRGTVTPASNFLNTTELLESQTQAYHRNGHAKALNPALKRLAVGSDMASTYLEFEIYAAAKHPVLVDTYEMHDGPQVTFFGFSSGRRQEARKVRDMSRQGFEILSQ
jgi:hypothetical protein